jgi:hypothetical protein
MSGGIWDGVPVNKVPANGVAWSRQADYGYPGELRKSLGMTRHVTSTAQTFVTAVVGNRVSNIFDVQIDSTNYLMCLKGDGATYDALWDITDGTSLSKVLQLVRPGASDEMYQKPWSITSWDDEVFIVNGKSTIDQGGNYTYGLSLSRSGGAWTTSDIGVTYATGKTTGPPSTAATTGSATLHKDATYGFRVLGYDTSKATYGGLVGALGTNMEVWVDTGTADQDVTITVTQSATSLGVDALRIFRTTRNGSDFYYEGALTGASTAFTTSMLDEQLVHQEAYDNVVGGNPPDTFYLVARHNERLMGIGTSDPSRLYFSKVGKPHAWKVDDYRELPNIGKPVGLASRGHLVHVHYDTGLIATITGQDVFTGTIATDCRETFGAVNDGTIVEATFKSYFVGNSGVMMFTGQACPQKVSYAIDGTWDDLTKGSLTQVSSVLAERARAKEYWSLFPADNLLIRVPVEGSQPGTNIGIDRMYGTCLGRQRISGETRIYMGTNEGAVFRLDTGDSYGTTAQLLDITVTSYTTGILVLDDAEATTNYGVLGMPVTPTSGPAKGEASWSTSQYGNIIITPQFTNDPVAGDRVLIGALPFDMYTRWFDLEREGQWKRWLGARLNIQDDANASNRSALLNVYAVAMDNISRSPRSAALDWQYVGTVDFQRPEAEWIGFDFTSVYLGLRFVCYDYQITRTIQSMTLKFEYLREGPQ